MKYLASNPSIQYGVYVNESLKYKVIERNEAFQALWIEIEFVNNSNIKCGILYR